MGVIFECDGCGKREAGYFVGLQWHKPPKWYQRSDKDGAWVACSRECIEVISKKTGKTGVVAPW